ncbi:MAG TPA: rod shape-determining protein MreC [Actinomycetota bacterium]
MYARPRRARMLLVLLLLASITVITIDFREGQSGPVAQLQRVSVAAFGPLQRGVSAVVRPVGAFFSGIGQIGRLRADNRRLTAEVEQLQSEERTYQDAIGENQRLRGTLGMAARCGCKTVGALVVARSGSNFQWSVTIDAGSSRGIASGMPVLDADGLVGRVSQVTAGYATVTLLDDPASGVAASLARTKGPGIVKGAAEAGLQFEPVQAGTDVRPGDEVVTRGYQGGVFPAGLPIGMVARVDPAGAASLVPTVTLRPYANLGTIDVVAVVVSQPKAPSRPRSGQRPQPQAGPAMAATSASGGGR